jgi:hypothetical protein
MATPALLSPPFDNTSGPARQGGALHKSRLAHCTKRWPPMTKTPILNIYSAGGRRRWRNDQGPMAPAELPIIIKRYANRLYHPAAGAYVTLGDLAAMIEDDEDFAVCDARSGEDITHSVLKQIIVERGSHG